MGSYDRICSYEPWLVRFCLGLFQPIWFGLSRFDFVRFLIYPNIHPPPFHRISFDLLYSTLEKIYRILTTMTMKRDHVKKSHIMIESGK